MSLAREAIDRILNQDIEDTEEIEKLKKDLSRKHGLERIPKNSEILEKATEEEKKKLRPILKKKPTRTMSGVSVIAIMTEPLECPGECVYCPGGIEQESPKSYTGEEPAAMRAEKNQYNAKKQVENRLKQLKDIGHPTDKIELILMGGTLPAHPEYQEKFVKGALDGLNQEESSSLEEAIEKNETTEHRCVGMTFETRPDHCKQKHVDKILELGGTRIEIGVQHPDNSIYKKIKRKHTVKDVEEATKATRTSLLKINYHLMPNLPGSNPEKDLKMFKEIFQDKRYKPDMLKIYPTLLTDPEKIPTGKTKLHDLWENGEWSYYGEEETIDLLAKARKHIPKYVRVMRTQRDIPAKLIKKGVTSSNLRQLVDKKAEELGIDTREIRYREIRDQEPDKTKLMVKKYRTKGTTERFISIEDTEKDKIIGFTRLSFPEESKRPEIDSETAGIRELHVYGPSQPIGSGKKGKIQHSGYGEKLLQKAEEIARKHGKDKMLITSGIGAREYYKKKGYKTEEPYMKKEL